MSVIRLQQLCQCHHQVWARREAYMTPPPAPSHYRSQTPLHPRSAGPRAWPRGVPPSTTFRPSAAFVPDTLTISYAKVVITSFRIVGTAPVSAHDTLGNTGSPEHHMTSRGPAIVPRLRRTAALGIPGERRGVPVKVSEQRASKHGLLGIQWNRSA